MQCYPALVWFARYIIAFWKGELAPAAIERLRRRFRRDFDAGTSLDRYVELRALDFVAFDEGWVATREDLPREVVATMIEARLKELLGSDADVELAPIEQVRASIGRAPTPGGRQRADDGRLVLQERS